MPEVFVGCGSNIEPERNLLWALDAMQSRFGPLRCSSVYRSPAFGFEGPDFLNLVVGFSSAAGADVIEAGLSELENQRGRDDDNRSGSRTLDLDLLIYGASVDPVNRLPRVDVLSYPFVLAPLAEIAPGLIHPVTGVMIAEAWDVAAQAVTELTLIGDLHAA